MDSSSPTAPLREVQTETTSRGLPPRNSRSATPPTARIKKSSSSTANTSQSSLSPEQALFEQRLFQDGVAVKKIGASGKASLRYVRCVQLPASTAWGLVWSTTKKDPIPLSHFSAVRQGKTTDRTRKSPAPANRLLSLVTPTRTLDLETPTPLDRDKFVQAFVKFLRLHQHDKKQQQKEGAASSTEPNDDDDEHSHVSSLTGAAAADHDLIEELHQALQDLRLELQESRAEASRAVQVAEHAIQSAEQKDDWQNTVTHQAAHAAAQAQQQASQALAQARKAKDQCQREQKTAHFWKTHALAAEADVALAKTQALAEQVQRQWQGHELEAWQRSHEAEQKQWQTRLQVLEEKQQNELEAALERNKALERELDVARQQLVVPHEKPKPRKSLVARRRESKTETTKSGKGGSATSTDMAAANHVAELHKLQAESTELRQQMDMLRRATAEELGRLPQNAKDWVEQIAWRLSQSKNEEEVLRDQLAIESVARRRLLAEVQDLRGVVRVYAKPCVRSRSNLLSFPSLDTMIIHREKVEKHTAPLSFECDRAFGLEASINEVYEELEDVCLSALEGYRVCLMAYGASLTGKTRTLVGDFAVSTDPTSHSVEIKGLGLHLQAMQHLLSIVEQRTDQFQDSVSLTIVEVMEDRLLDMLAGTSVGDSTGSLVSHQNSRTLHRKQSSTDDSESADNKSVRLEIKHDVHGDTIVQGALSIEVASYEQLCQVWKECMALRAQRVSESGIDDRTYNASSNIIATVVVSSTNVTTGQSTLGKLQFVDLAAANLVRKEESSDPKPTPTPDDVLALGPTPMKYEQKCLERLQDVVTARTRFHRSIPYRNSTLTHLLRDSLEADAKVVLIVCVSSDPSDLVETTAALRFASLMRRVHIGKATKHSLTPP